MAIVCSVVSWGTARMFLTPLTHSGMNQTGTARGGAVAEEAAVAIAAARQPQSPACNQRPFKESESPFKQPQRISGTKRLDWVSVDPLVEATLLVCRAVIQANL